MACNRDFPLEYTIESDDDDDDEFEDFQPKVAKPAEIRFVKDGCQLFCTQVNSRKCGACGCDENYHLIHDFGEKRKSFQVGEVRTAKRTKLEVEETVGESSDSSSGEEDILEAKVEKVKVLEPEVVDSVDFELDDEQSAFLSRFLVTKSRSKQCPVCLRSFLSSSNLAGHMLKHQADTSQLECMYCLEKFGNRSQEMLRHIASVHYGEVKPFKCPRCNTNFAVESTLSVHFNSNCSTYGANDQTPHCTSLSQEAASMLSNQEADFVRSRFIWNSYRAYQCSRCLVCYKSVTDLRKHHHASESETSDEFECHYCLLAFDQDQVDDYLVHIGKEHNRSNPFLCRLCDVRYLNAAALTTHRKGSLHKAKEIELGLRQAS
jgi:hypothetical protein